MSQAAMTEKDICTHFFCLFVWILRGPCADTATSTYKWRYGPEQGYASSEARGLPSVPCGWGPFWLFSQSLWQTLQDMRLLS